MLSLCPSTFHIGHIIITWSNVLQHREKVEHRNSASFVLVYRVRPLVMVGTTSVK